MWAPFAGPCGCPSGIAPRCNCPVLPAPPRPSWTKKVAVLLRPSAALRGQKRCSPCPFVALRGQKKVFFAPLRGPSRTKKVFFPPSAALRGQKVLPLPFSAPSAALRGQKKVLRCSSWPFGPLRGQNGVKVFSVPLRVGAPLVVAVLPPLWVPFVGYSGVRIKMRLP